MPTVTKRVAAHSRSTGGAVVVAAASLHEGTVVPVKQSIFSLQHGHDTEADDRHWLTNYQETLLVEVWYHDDSRARSRSNGSMNIDLSTMCAGVRPCPGGSPSQSTRRRSRASPPSSRRASVVSSARRQILRGRTVGVTLAVVALHVEPRATAQPRPE